MDRTIAFSSVGQTWSLFAGPITLLLIMKYLSPATQGYYYTFGGIAAITALLELGFAQCVTQFASHEFAKLRFGPGGVIVGDPEARSRLISLGRLSLKWYGIMAFAAFLLLGFGGHLFFAMKDSGNVDWIIPWWCVSVTTGLTLLTLPLMAFLEGCNQTAFIYGLRTACRIGASVTVWILLLMGQGLLAGALMGLTPLVIMAAALVWHWPGLFRELATRPAAGVISWRQEIFPFQWRIAISWIGSYLAYSLFTPILFHFQSPEIAGKMGATMQLIASLHALSSAWTMSKGPQFSILVSDGRFADLDRLFYRSTRQGVSVCIGGGLLLLGALEIVHQHFALGSRFIDVGPAACLVLATVCNQVLFSQALYLQAHKQVKFMVLTVANGLTSAVLLTVFGALFSVWGVCITYASVQLVMLLWATSIWRRFRKDEQQSPVAA